MKLSAILIALASLTLVAAQGPCCICDNCGIASSRENAFLDGSGTTCTDKVLEAAQNYRQGSSQCSTVKSRFYDICCDASKPYTPPVQALPADPCDVYPFADKGPACNLCHDGSYPKNEKTQVAVLGLTESVKNHPGLQASVSGNPTCGALYCLAKKGFVSNQLCSPMQDYMDVPCGCYARFTGGNSPTVQQGYVGDNGNVPDKKDIPKQSDDGKDEVERLGDQKRKRGNINRNLKGA